MKFSLKNSQNRRLKVLFVVSEAAPFIKIGGLGEVMFALPKDLRSLGYDVRVMMPKYAVMDSGKFPLKLIMADLKPMGETHDSHGLFVSNILSYENDAGETTAYFLENMEYYEKRANTYGYADDAVRWALLSKATLEFLKGSDWLPDVIVSSDWQAGLIPNYLRTDYKDDAKLSRVAAVFSIHNLSYQGMFDPHFVNEMDVDSGQEKIPAFDDPRLLKLNFMRRGIMYADLINTVSPTYAQEITTSEYGELLNDLLSERRSRLFGVLNGIDYESYNPETDTAIDFTYSAKTLKRREKNKLKLKQKFDLDGSANGEDVPLVCIISRLTDQKGFGLLFETARPLLDNFKFELVILGAGESHFMSFFHDLMKEYPGRVAGHFTYDDVLPRTILSAADMILIPSKFEPSGLTQMEAMRYGVVPIVRKTGGLADSVIDYNAHAETGTGFVFEPFDQYAFFGTVVKALETYRYPEHWQGLQKRAMAVDFSWHNSAKEYGKLFEKAMEFHRHVNS
ncbi:hypothetical protein A3A38_03230 [Candidatus Kaiserbacteria bacterium RIFCSPLOWO2_01_FULL_53_17]|uniref:Glycogen synthase n=1 Tax=Candidatus Kaiserbacteria bacterium RIFCSPLOWO2_01_FULL_53_17 TaxID=1798511 RepID=A0A1F6EH57_9BACT|nr:MAG: hypothetical protein A3A38_03230 [Candidatus Kaiserbacteria bacterium RIFCSPLOWO2_01_FULL_53_17]